MCLAKASVCCKDGKAAEEGCRSLDHVRDEPSPTGGGGSQGCRCTSHKCGPLVTVAPLFNASVPPCQEPGNQGYKNQQGMKREESKNGCRVTIGQRSSAFR